MTRSVDYDAVAAAYDKRYETYRFDGVAAVLRRFLGQQECDVAEVACGTGHWLVEIRRQVRFLVGLDLSAAMLKRARTAAPSAHIVRGRAEMLPWVDGRFDRLFCINALHHFRDPDAFLMEARRVLRPGGALLIVSLDPHTGLDQWWVYDYFPKALDADLARHQPTSAIRHRLETAGFVEPATEVAQHTRTAVPFAVAKQRSILERHAASQLMMLADADYEEGLHRLKTEQPTLRSDLRFYATTGWVPPGS